MVGPCVSCGGPQQWTFIAGERYVRCERECGQLVIDGFEPSLMAIGSPADPFADFPTEHDGSGRVDTLEGGAADDVARSALIHVGVPLEAVLFNLWTGGPDGTFE